MQSHPYSPASFSWQHAALSAPCLYSRVSHNALLWLTVFVAETKCALFLHRILNCALFILQSYNNAKVSQLEKCFYYVRMCYVLGKPERFRLVWVSKIQLHCSLITFTERYAWSYCSHGYKAVHFVLILRSVKGCSTEILFEKTSAIARCNHFKRYSLTGHKETSTSTSM